MDAQTIEFEAESLDDARRQVPSGYRSVSEEVLSDGSPKTVQGVGANRDQASEDAHSKIQSGAETIALKELVVPGRRSYTVSAFDEQEARSSICQKVGPGSIVHGIQLQQPGRRGFLGIGRQQGLYEVVVDHLSVVELTYRIKPRIRLKLRKLLSLQEIMNSLIELERLLGRLTGVPSVRGASGVPMTDPRVFAGLGLLSDQYNILLGDAKVICFQNPVIQNLQALDLGPPKSLALDEIFSEYKQLDKASDALKRFREALIPHVKDSS